MLHESFGAWRVPCQQDDAARCAAWGAKVDRSFAALRPQLAVLGNSSAMEGLSRLSEREVYDLYLPTWSCEALERVPQQPGDGPKWMCGLDALHSVSDCLVYSFGANGDSSFERAMKARNPHCQIFTFDPSMPSRQNISGRCHKARLEHCPYEPGWKLKATRDAAKQGIMTKFVEIGLAAHDGPIEIFPGKQFPAMTLPSLMKMLGHENRTINVLKIDIEGSEYTTLPHASIFGSCGKHGHRHRGTMPIPVEQLQIELHGTNAVDVGKIFASVYSCGLQVFSVEPNRWGCDGYGCLEFSLVGPQQAMRSFLNTHPGVSEAWTQSASRLN